MTTNTNKQQLTPGSPEQIASPLVAGRAAPPQPAQPRVLRRILALDDFEDAARRVIPRPIFGYVTGGVETNASLRANRAVLDEIALRSQDAGGHVRAHHEAATLFGHTYDAPFGIAPMGGTAMAAYRATSCSRAPRRRPTFRWS